MGGVEAKDLLFRVAAFQKHGPNDLLQLLEDRTGLVPLGDPGQLHGQCASTAADCSGGEIQAYGPCHGGRVDARMIIETLVLEGDQASLEFVGKSVRLGKTPLPVRGDAGAQKIAILGIEQGGISI